MASRNRGQEIQTASDGLPALSVSEHAREKEFRLQNITSIFTQAMKNKWQGSLYYVDPFCGPGKCLIKNSKEEVEGSPIIAAKAPFNHYYFADEDEHSVKTLRKRIERIDLSDQQVHYYTGKASDTINQILKELPHGRKSLGLAVLDPWAWDFAFSDLAKLTRNRRLDILVNFNIGDMKRWWHDPNQDMDSFLNTTTDHREYFNAENRAPNTRTLLDHYEAEMKKIGYPFTSDNQPVTNSKNTPLYHIIFGSKHRLGKKLHDAVSTRNVHGQYSLMMEIETNTP